MALALLGKRALVTGGSRGIGRSIALRLARDGADIAVTGRRNSSHLKQVAEEIKALGRECLFFSCDLGVAEQVQGLFAELAGRWSELHILINNAAVGSFAPADELTLRQWQFTLERSVTSALLCTQGSVKMMTQGWGRVVNISSLGSSRYLPDYAAVGASKAALESLTRSFAVELAPRGIVVNAVSAGLVQTSSLKRLPASIQAQVESYAMNCPSGRIASPGDIADVVALLCREEARWIVGQTLIADGGFSLK